MSLYTIPFPVGPLHYSVIVVLSDENIERIRERDPVEVVTPEIAAVMGPEYAWRTLRDVVITYATADEMVTAAALIKDGKVREALQLLTRGYRYRPDRGDGGKPERG